MLKIYIALILSCLAFSNYAQHLEREVVSEGGNTIKNGLIELSVSIGETATTRINNNSVVLSQGFEQHRDLYLLAVINFKKHQLKIYPNPSSQYISISSDLFISQMSIVNATGQTVKLIKVNSNKSTSYIGDLPKGIYFIKINQTKTHSQIISKFIKI